MTGQVVDLAQWRAQHRTVVWRDAEGNSVDADPGFIFLEPQNRSEYEHPAGRYPRRRTMIDPAGLIVLGVIVGFWAAAAAIFVWARSR
jgi:hypothetical protein